MKHYSLYEIEKLTDGKLTKYRLKQAINEGLLKATYTNPKRRGPGSPSYLVAEEDLELYLSYIRTSKRVKIEVDPAPKTEIEALKERVAILESETTLQNTFIRAFMEEHQLNSKTKKSLLSEISSNKTFRPEQVDALSKSLLTN